MDSQDLDASLLVEQVLDEFDINCMRDDDDEEEEQKSAYFVEMTL